MERIDIPVLGFAPDMDITTPGRIAEGNDFGGFQFAPTQNGIGPLPGRDSVGMDDLANTCRGAVVARKLDDSRRVIAGTQTKLYEQSGTTWSDVSAGGGSYTGGAENRWRFAQFGNATIATNRTDAVQAGESGAFAALAGSPPKASLVETCNGQVLFADYNDGSDDFQDGWWTSALQDHEDYALSVATGSVNGRLTETPGPIRAWKRLGNNMVAYKERSMYLGFQDGPPTWWRWQLVPGDIGAVSQEAVVDIGTAHIFVGFDDFYYFDGSRPVSIGQGILKTWFQENAEASYRYRIQHIHDRPNQRIFFYLPDSDGNLTFGPVFHYGARRWGYLDHVGIGPLEAGLEYISAGVTYHSLGTLYSTYNDLPAIPYDSPFWTSGAPVPAGFYGTTHTLKSLTNLSGAATAFRFNMVGDPQRFRNLTRIIPKYRTAPANGYCYAHHTQNLGSSVTSTLAGNLGPRYDFLISSRWFAPSFYPVGNFELTGVSMYFEDDGEE